MMKFVAFHNTNFNTNVMSVMPRRKKSLDFLSNFNFTTKKLKFGEI